MLLSRFFRRRDVRSIRRSLPCRRPLVEALEGRQLLSTFTMTKVESPAIVGNHIGTSAIQGNHIGTSAIQGNHIGTSAIQGNHIGTSAIVGNHIG
jgi:hypothetical protein